MIESMYIGANGCKRLSVTIVRKGRVEGVLAYTLKKNQRSEKCAARYRHLGENHAIQKISLRDCLVAGVFQ